MTTTLQELKDASFNLPTDERAELARFLFESLGDGEPGWDEAWQIELAQRLDEIRDGRIVGIPAGEAIGRLRERYP